MDYTIGSWIENGDYNDFRRFENVKITKQTVIDTVAAVSDESVLNIDENGDGKYDVKLRGRRKRIRRGSKNTCLDLCGYRWRSGTFGHHCIIRGQSS